MTKNTIQEQMRETRNPDWVFRTSRWNTGKCEVCAYSIKSSEKYYGKVNNTDKRRHVKCYQALITAEQRGAEREREKIWEIIKECSDCKAQGVAEMVEVHLQSLNPSSEK